MPIILKPYTIFTALDKYYLHKKRGFTKFAISFKDFNAKEILHI